MDEPLYSLNENSDTSRSYTISNDFLSLSLSFSDAPVSELSLELLLLQVVLPALLEQGHTRQWLKGLVRAWTVTAGYLL